MIRKSLTIIICLLIVIECSIIKSSAVVEPTFSVQQNRGEPGQEISIEVNIENNPGIQSFLLEIGYDTNILTLKDYEKVDFELMTGPTDQDPFVISWYDGVSGECTDDGTIARLIFEIKKDAIEGTYPITISYDPDDVFDKNDVNVWFETVDNYITVVSSDEDFSVLESEKEYNAIGYDNNESGPEFDNFENDTLETDPTLVVSDKGNEVDLSSDSIGESKSMLLEVSSSNKTLTDDDSSENVMTGVSSKIATLLFFIAVIVALMVVVKRKK